MKTMTLSFELDDINLINDVTEFLNMFGYVRDQTGGNDTAMNGIPVVSFNFHRKPANYADCWSVRFESLGSFDDVKNFVDKTVRQYTKLYAPNMCKCVDITLRRDLVVDWYFGHDKWSGIVWIGKTTDDNDKPADSDKLTDVVDTIIPDTFAEKLLPFIMISAIVFAVVATVWHCYSKRHVEPSISEQYDKLIHVENID